MSFDFSCVCGFVMWNLPGLLAARTWQQSPRLFVHLGVEWQDFFFFFLQRSLKSSLCKKHPWSGLHVGGNVLQSDQNQVELSGPAMWRGASLRLPLEGCMSATQTKHPFLHHKTCYFNRGVCMFHTNFSVSAFTGKFRVVFTFDGVNLCNGL